MAADIGTSLAAAAAAYPSPPNYSSPPHQPPSISSLYDRAAMSSSLSPNPASQSSFSGGSPAPQDKSPLSSLNLNFLKTLTEKRTTRDGQPPKRRGPKPDSKPALTRRQELNRQAQRTHRERKELYIKALEDEVLRLKEIYSNVSQDKEKLAEENRQLKALLTQGGLGGGLGAGVGGSSVLDDAMSNPSVGYASSASVTGSYAPAPSSHTSAFTPPLSATNMVPPHSRGTGSAPSPQATSHTHGGPHVHHQHHHSGQGQHLGGGSSAGGQTMRNPNLDYDQAGIDFVLTYEDPSQVYMSPPSHHP